ACSDSSGGGTISSPFADAIDGDGGAVLLPDSSGPETRIPLKACTVGDECDDGFACTKNDTCIDSLCVGETYECNDGMECTRDHCDGKGGCFSELISGNWCLIAGSCYADGSINPTNPCQTCITPITANLWSVADGAACNDGLECTTKDSCLGGACQGVKDACDDNNPCTTNGCSESQGCIHAALQGPCEDGDFCTTGDFCNNKECLPGSDFLDCSDGDPCTSDACNELGDCAHVSHSGPCEDGDPCTAGDTCEFGECLPGTQTPSCDDNNPCTDDVCLNGTGCVHIPNLASCDDGDPCTEGDTCSDYVCTSGFFGPPCDDKQICTQDVCEPFKGCAHFPAAGNCDDGNPCTQNTSCSGGQCTGGTSTPCDDDNPCTNDVCDAKVPGGCYHSNNSNPCDNGNVCTIDTCEDGACIPSPLGCNDSNDCTIDSCDPETGCKHVLSGLQGCQIQVYFTSPARASALTGNKNITVKGKVISPAGPIQSLVFNGEELPVNNNGQFVKKITAVHGLNVLTAKATDIFSNSDDAVQSFYFSTAYQGTNINDPQGSSMAKALYFYLGPESIDDGNHSPDDADDLATLFELMIQSVDIGAAIPNPAIDNSDYKVVIDNIKYDPAKVSLVTMNGGLQLYASIKNMTADVDADGKCWYCPNLSGDVTINEIVITSDLFISSKNGKAKVSMKNTDVSIYGLNVDINGILGNLFDFIVDYVVGQFAPTLENTFKSELGQKVPDALESALNALAFNAEFKMGPFFEGGPQGTLYLSSGLEATEWDQEGGVLRLWGSATAEKGISTQMPGTLKRDACMSGGVESLDLSKDAPLQFALSHDFMNQILFATWWSGALELPLSPEILAQQDLTQYGISDLSLNVSFLLPPTITSCNPYDELFFQVGDVKIHASLNLFGQEVEMDIFASASAYMEVVLTETGLALELQDFQIVETDVVVLTPGKQSIEKIIKNMVGENLIPQVFGTLAGDAFGGISLPEIDLDDLVDGLPPGSKIAINPTQVDRELGWFVVSGKIQ
ncbi:MAG TPA: hypothetical protein EYN06_01960, partial [Myxococcales bacterium]|nr:hypothetical protein [Myxococcales bacterium]